ncbi:MAG: SRPBCC family protein [Fibrobacter sp.]|uniref:hypothetical protein n=1 Tax=Fibrobacter sp. TaxID=35828 RepID=UPI00389111E9|nr:SRPBCC family protein [Fibrobacter sp.]
METLQYAPLNLTIGKNPILHYTLPKELESGALVKYHIQFGLKTINWTGIISSVSDNQVTVRLGEGPFRGFTASHRFVSEGNITGCYDEFSFQGFTTIPESTFADIMANASVVYGIFARKSTREIMLAYETQKKTQAFEALDQSATAG